MCSRVFCAFNTGLCPCGGPARQRGGGGSSLKKTPSCRRQEVRPPALRARDVVQAPASILPPGWLRSVLHRQVQPGPKRHRQPGVCCRPLIQCHLLSRNAFSEHTLSQRNFSRKAALPPCMMHLERNERTQLRIMYYCYCSSSSSSWPPRKPSWPNIHRMQLLFKGNSKECPLFHKPVSPPFFQ